MKWIPHFARFWALPWVLGAVGHSREPAPFSPSLPPEIPSLHRHYSAFLVLRTSPPPCRANLTLAGCRLARATPPAGLPVLRPIPSSIHATANTPAEPVGARVARFPTAGSLPRFNGGSASAVRVSRPARRLLALWPVWSLSRPRRPFVIGVLQTMLLPPPSAPTATGWSDSCRAGFAPAEEWRLPTAHVKMYAGSPRRGLPQGSRGTPTGAACSTDLVFQRDQGGVGWRQFDCSTTAAGR